MAVSNNALVMVSAIVAAMTSASLPTLAAPWAKSADIYAEPTTEQVSSRGRRNRAFIAGAVGFGVLGIAAAAAASQQRGGYYGGYAEQPVYGYNPSYGQYYEAAPRRQVYQQDYIYEQEPVYQQRRVYQYEYAQPYGYDQRFAAPVPVYGRHQYRRVPSGNTVLLDGLGRPTAMRESTGNN